MQSRPWDSVPQPSDDAVAGSPWFFVDTYTEFQGGLEALLKELEGHRNTVQLMGLAASPYEEEVRWIRGMVDWGKERLAGAAKSKDASIIVHGVTFASLRYLKAGILYQAFLIERQKRKFIAEAPIIPRSVVRSFDVRIEQLRNMAEMGKLSGLRPAEVIFELEEAEDKTVPERREQAKSAAPTPILLSDIPVVDPVLRKRCLTLLAALDSSDTAEQLDSVVREMSVVLEDRVRELAGVDGRASGAELFAATMAREPVLIRFSTERDIQDAAHLFFRGYSGLVRNEVMHRLVKSYTRERALQLLATVDYLLYLLSNAQIGGKSDS